MKGWVASRWFALADMVCVLIGASWWLSQSAAGAWPLSVALAPWLLRILAGRFPFRRTPLDGALLVFLITAGVGVWAAYDRSAAWAKFWVLVSAVLFYYALAAQPPSNLWLVAGFFGLIAVGMTSYFLLTNDWAAQTTKFAWLTQVGRWWMTVRPAVPAPSIHPNDVAYLTAMMTPFLGAHVLRDWRDQRWGSFGVKAFALGLVLIGLLLTASRGAWAALGVALGVWLLWQLSGWVGVRANQRRVLVFSVALILAGAVVTVAGAFAQRWLGPINSRADLQLNTLPLVADFLFTGGGLQAFPGLYSRYVLVIPDFFLIYSHNLFLDIAVEQGIFGWLAFVAVVVVSVSWLIRAAGKAQAGLPHVDLLRWAVATSWIVVALHGLVDDTLYGAQGSPLVFALAGLAASVTSMELFADVARRWRPQLAWAVPMLLVVAVGALLVFRSNLLARWYANLGAVAMAQVELRGWPEAARWRDEIAWSEYVPAVAAFQRALQLSPGNVTANYRLGLIAEKHGDDAEAVAYWEAAHRSAPAQRGVRKVLGLAYVWQNRLEEATSLLSGIPEAKQELGTYAWWWGTQGREDRAARAAEMVQRLP